MSDVNLPGLGPVPKKWFLIVGGGAVVTTGYVMYRKKKAPAAAAGTDTGTAALTGQPCVDSNGNPGVYDSSGICQAGTAALGGYYAGSGAGGVSGVTPAVPGTGGFTTNGQWTQQAEADMQGTGVDPGTLAAALGAYITGQPVSVAQQSLIDQAIAFEGYPPVAGPSGYPPAIKLQPTGSTGGITGGTVAVPECTGLTTGAAHNAIVAAGLVPTDVTGDLHGEYAWTCTGTTPAGGTQVAPGSSVAIKSNPPVTATGQKYTYVTVIHYTGPGNVPWNGTLSGIADHYKVPGGYMALAKLNGISNPNLVHPGQQIKVPVS